MYKLSIAKLLGFWKAHQSKILITSLSLLILMVLFVTGRYFWEFLKTPEGSALSALITLTTGIWFFWDKIVAVLQPHLNRQNSCPPGTVCSITKADLETPRGKMRLDSRFYVERPPNEENSFAEILKPGALIRIKAPRQMGKTSLLSRILQHARQFDQARTVELSFQEIDAECFEKLECFLKWFCERIASQLGIDPQIGEHWSNEFSHKTNATEYFEKYLLPQLTTPLVLGLDEVDRLFSYDKVAKDVLSQWRNWHERGKDNASWAQVRLIIVHSQEVYVPLNINESPFNVGLPIQLPEFTLAQVQDLARRHGLGAWSEADSQRLMQMVGGHPFLVRQAFYEIAGGNLTLDQLLKDAPTEAGIYHEHLYHHWSILQESGLHQVMKQVALSPGAVAINPQQVFKLHSMGLVKRVGDNVVPTFDLYREYFQKRL